MNFDQLKNQWNTADESTEQISATILKIKEAHTPIDKIRKQMKSEFFVQILSLLLMAFSPRIFGFAAETKSVFIVFYAIMCGFTTYYFFKFYIFYKNSYDLSLDTRKNLLWFYYEMKMNIELYKALTYILGFIALSFVAVYCVITKSSLLLRVLDKMSLSFIVLNCFITILLIGIITELWARFSYGKYVKQIKVIIDNLDEE